MSLLWPAFFLAFNLQIFLFDFRQRRVPNILILFALIFQILWLIGAAFNTLPPPLGSAKVLDLLLSFVISLAVLLPLWRFKIFGAGDVKYIATLGFLLGYHDALTIVLLGSAVMGAYALLLILLKTIPRFYLFAERQKERRLPYAGFMGLVSLFWIFWQLN